MSFNSSNRTSQKITFKIKTELKDKLMLSDTFNFNEYFLLLNET